MATGAAPILHVRALRKTFGATEVLRGIDLKVAPQELVFIIGRVAGLTAEVAEEYAREKPMRIKIPVTYDGPPPKSE